MHRESSRSPLPALRGGGLEPWDAPGDGGVVGATGDDGSAVSTPEGGSPDAGGQSDAGRPGPLADASSDAAIPPAPLDADWLPDPASHVNTVIGTTAGGNMFPAQDVPFGMLQWSPDTSPDRSAKGGLHEYKSTPASSASA